MRTIGFRIILFGLALVIVTLNVRLNAQSRPNQFVPFSDFLMETTVADSSEYLARETSHVKDAASFEQMRQYILSMYQDIEVTHSFLLYSDYVDCVPITEQPSVRLLGLKKIASPPVQWILSNGGPLGETVTTATQAEPGNQFDEFGNSAHCEKNTIPMRRITLDEVARFVTLSDFFKKAPDDVSHKYAHAYQSVDNLGGSSTLNIWRPYVNESSGEIFSLSQVWYVGGSGANLQTVEGGWQNYPVKYGNQNSRLFIFWTADNYQHGCYNLDCPAFVQTDNTWTLGGGFQNYSTAGGSQYDFQLLWKFIDPNWWLGIGGTFIGYYPGLIFGNGQLTRKAQRIDYGGETVGGALPDDSYPPMGSGDWANKGYKYAAYQKQIVYLNTDSKAKAPTLTKDQPSKDCYTITDPSTYTNWFWGVSFFFGGPGGPGWKC